MPWLIWVCPVPVQCPQPGIQTRGWAGRDREVTLHWHSRSRFSAAAAETHMSWSFLIIQDGDVGVGVGDPLVCAAAV